MRIQYIASLVTLATLLVPGLGWAAEAPKVRLTPAEAVQRALRHNLALQYERLSPALTGAAEKAASAPYDVNLFAGTDVSGSPGSISRARAGLPPVSSTSAGLEVGVRKVFTTGTTVETKLGTSGLFGSGSLDPGYQTTLSVNVRQNLLRGVSMDANEAGITSARLGRKAAGDQLDRKAELVAAQALQAYWDLHAALSQRDVQKVALEQAERTLSETQALIQAGKQAAAEAVAAQYQVQVQRRAVSQAEQAIGNARDRLARIIGMVGPRSLATPRIVTAATPAKSVPGTSLPKLQEQALAKRGDYLAQKVAIESRAVEAQAAAHELWPKLELVGGVNFTGLSGTMSDGTQNLAGLSTNYFGSYAMDRVGWSVGLQLEVPLGNRAAESKREVADLELKRAKTALEQLELGISEELNVAWRSVRSAHEQLQITESAVKVAETKLENEQIRYRAGKTTAHILTTIQGEVVRERLNREQALADFNKALVQLWTASGTLMGRSGLSQS